MAINLNVSGMADYTARATEIIQESILTNDAFAFYGVQDGVDYKQKMDYIDITFELAGDTCSKTEITSGATMTQKDVETIFYNVDKTYCFDQLHKKGKTIEQVLGPISETTAKLWNKKMNDSLWQGDVIGNDGWLSQLDSDSVVIASASTYTTITESNVDEIVNLTIDGMSAGLEARGETETLYIFVSSDTFKKYKRNRIQNNMYMDALNASDINSNIEMPLLGDSNIHIKKENGLRGIDTLIFTYKDNLKIVRDEVIHTTSMEWIPMPNKTFIHRVDANWGTQVQVGADAVRFKLA